jgi:threonine/homoserine/homoserine lactone efflux protein
MGCMNVLSAVASFAVVAGMLTLVPGLDTALVLRTAVTRGRRAAFAAALGINTGSLIWGAAAAVGVAALLTASRLAYQGLRLVGAGYVIWLGAKLLWESRKRKRPDALEDEAAATGQTRPKGQTPDGAGAPPPEVRGADRARDWWVRGLATNLLNPKVGVFYVTMLPTFIPAQSPHLLVGLLMAGVHDVEGMAWFAVLISGTTLIRRWLASDAVQRLTDRVTGLVLVGFGLKLGLDTR